jgi:uncharacterized protein YukE
MATISSIEFEFNKANSQADKLDEIANGLNKLSNIELQETLQNLSVSWKGENASAYLYKCSLLQEEISCTSIELHSIASNIRTIAKHAYTSKN